MTLHFVRSSLLGATAALLLCALPQVALAKGPTTTISEKALPVGTVVEQTQSSKLGMKMDISFNGQAQHREVSEESKTVQQVEVLATEGQRITKAKVTYKSQSQTKTEDGKSNQMPAPAYLNKTYTVSWAKDGQEFKVADASGQEPPVVELEHVRKDFQGMGKPNDFLKILPKGALTPGQKINITKELAAEMFGGDKANSENMDLTNSVLVFKGTKKVQGKEAALFDMVLSLKGAEGPLNMSMDLKGKVTLVVDGGWPIEVTLSGPMSMASGAQQGPSLNGKGQMEFGKSATYKLP